MKKQYLLRLSPLAALLMAAGTYAQPFQSLDARSMAMGDAGVAAARPGAAPLFNPALLSHYDDDTDFGMLLPNIGMNAFAKQETLDAVQNIDDEAYFDSIQDDIDSYNNITISNASDANQAASISESVAATVRGLNGELGNLSGHPININGASMFSISIPTTKVAFSIYGNVQAFAEVVPNITKCDQQLLDDYADLADEVAALLRANSPGVPSPTNTTSVCGGDVRTLYDANGYVDPLDENGDGDKSDTYFKSDVEIIGIAIEEYGLALSHRFDINGKGNLSFGMTPKWLNVTSTFANPGVQAFDDDDYEVSDDLEEHEVSEGDFNMDVGFATSFLDDKLRLGLSVKNIIAQTYETKRSNAGVKYDIAIDPQARFGLNWDGPMGLSLATDLDLTTNEAFFTKQETQYWSAGLEWDIARIFRMRAGFRENLAGEDDESTLITAGFGFNIIAFHFDFAAQASEDNVGGAFQLGVEF